MEGRQYSYWKSKNKSSQSKTNNNNNNNNKITVLAKFTIYIKFTKKFQCRNLIFPEFPFGLGNSADKNSFCTRVVIWTLFLYVLTDIEILFEKNNIIMFLVIPCIFYLKVLNKLL